MSEAFTRDPEICGGELCIAGTRISVSAVRSFAAAGYSAEAIQREYPSLSIDQIKAAVEAPTQSPADASEVVVVPLEPTDEMHHTGQDVMETGNASDVWSAMLASRPAQPPIPAVCAEDVARAVDPKAWEAVDSFGAVRCPISIQQRCERSLEAAARILSMLPGGERSGTLASDRWPDLTVAEVESMRKDANASGADVGFEGYKAAFYEVADMLGIPAMPISPSVVWRLYMRPMLRQRLPAALTSVGSSALRPSACVPSGDVNGGAGHNRDEAFCEAFYDSHLTHALDAMREGRPYQINADSAFALIQQAAADRRALRDGRAGQ